MSLDTTTNTNTHEDDSEDEFGSFDDAINEREDSIPTDNDIDDDIIQLTALTDYTQLEPLMNDLFNVEPNNDNKTSTIDMLLNERLKEIYSQLSKPPHLKPNYWLKLKIRHNLLLKLGIPINLDELSTNSHVNYIVHARRKSINEQDINWDGYDIPKYEALSMTDEEKQHLVVNTDQLLLKFDSDNLSDTSKVFLQNANETQLHDKLLQLQYNYDTLIKLSAIWKNKFKESKDNFEIYESVVQNFIGYSQKLERDALLKNLKHLGKSKKRGWKS